MKSESEIEQLQNELNQLRKENLALNNNLFELNRKLRDSEQLKSHFISNITNEIVNPFTGIMALAGNIKKLKDGEITLAKRMADLIYEEASHLDFQLRNIFAVASIEAGIERLNYSKVKLLSAVSDLEKMFGYLLTKRRLTFSVRFIPDDEYWSGVEMITDYGKLMMILGNIINNAIKFSPEDSFVDLMIEYHGRSFKFVVSDRGKGIEPSDRKVIFDRFKQLDEKINSINTGHGLGLSIVLAFTEMMDGKVEISGNVHGGTNVTVIFPEQQIADFDDLEDFIVDPDSLF